jgi:hypothetical protein
MTSTESGLTADDTEIEAVMVGAVMLLLEALPAFLFSLKPPEVEGPFAKVVAK